MSLIINQTTQSYVSNDPFQVTIPTPVVGNTLIVFVGSQNWGAEIYGFKQIAAAISYDSTVKVQMFYALVKTPVVTTVDVIPNGNDNGFICICEINGIVASQPVDNQISFTSPISGTEMTVTGFSQLNDLVFVLFGDGGAGDDPMLSGSYTEIASYQNQNFFVTFSYAIATSAGQQNAIWNWGQLNFVSLQNCVGLMASLRTNLITSTQTQTGVSNLL